MSKLEDAAKNFIRMYLKDTSEICKVTEDEVHIRNIGLKSKELINQTLNYITGMNGNVVTIKYSNTRLVIHCDI